MKRTRIETMNSAMIELLILAAIAVFVFMRLKSVLGTRTGFEKPTTPPEAARRAPEAPRPSRDFEVIPGGVDVEDEIAKVADIDGETADALRRMAQVEPGFSPSGFLEGAKRAYEMILMAYENGDTETLRPLLSDEVYESFAAAIERRKAEGLVVDARFVGVREAKIFSAMFSEETGEADVEVRFVGELVSVVRNADHDIVEGDPNEVRRQTDLWTFTRKMGANDPNWVLSATGG